MSEQLYTDIYNAAVILRKKEKAKKNADANCASARIHLMATVYKMYTRQGLNVNTKERNIFLDHVVNICKNTTCKLDTKTVWKKVFTILIF